ncbi:hypothetical protein MHU86_6834 [Fragilaria crotonensis]|nr:hypothetical protein MHU86_6834 [Fragilaria crotonensis]
MTSTAAVAKINTNKVGSSSMASPSSVHTPPPARYKEPHLSRVLEIFSLCLENDIDNNKMTWANALAKELMDNSKINTIAKLSRHCRQQQTQYHDNHTPPSRFRRAGIVQSSTTTRWNIDSKVLAKLQSFLPGPVGDASFQLARQAVERVEQDEWNRTKRRGKLTIPSTTTMTDSSATNSPHITKYAHRCKHGGQGREEWIVRRIGHVNNHRWAIDRLYVDCAGFIRNVLCSVMDIDEFTLTKSDRDFMRAKDFFNFFKSITHSVGEPDCDVDVATVDGASTTIIAEGVGVGDERLQSWRRVDDLRMLLPGDIIVYRREGMAAGGAAFTLDDLKDLLTLLKAVRTAQVYEEYDDETGEDLVDYNVAKDEAIEEWAMTLKDKLSSNDAFGITDLAALRTLAAEVPSFWSDLKEYMDSENCYENDTVDRMYEALYASEGNTGHIMFAAGLAEIVGKTADKEEYRVAVFHSTGFGRKYKGTNKRRRGVERSYRRFTRILATNKWIRERGDGDLSGGGVVDVLAARICG